MFCLSWCQILFAVYYTWQQPLVCISRRNGNPYVDLFLGNSHFNFYRIIGSYLFRWASRSKNGKGDDIPYLHYLGFFRPILELSFKIHREKFHRQDTKSH